MVNLPKPSSFAPSGEEQRFQYLTTYLTKLVTELNRTLNRNGQQVTANEVAVKDIGFTDNKLVVKYTDGKVKYITIGESNG